MAGSSSVWEGDVLVTPVVVSLSSFFCQSVTAHIRNGDGLTKNAPQAEAIKQQLLYVHVFRPPNTRKIARESTGISEKGSCKRKAKSLHLRCQAPYRKS